MEHIFEWSLLIIILIALTYSAYIIKNEKNVAINTGVKIEFGGLEFIIPRWWTQVSEDLGKLIFKRTDTHYEWQATFVELDESFNHLSLQNCFEKYAISQNLIFDEENAIIKVPNEILSFKNLDVEALRIEGTATQESERRVYIDLVFFKNESKIFLLESKSSILNGLLEGPFFEEMIFNIKKPK